MAIILSDNIQNNSNKPDSAKYGPYTTIALAKLIPVPYRHQGLTVGVIEGDGIVEYWWKAGTTDGHLIKKSSGTGEGGANGLSAYEVWLSVGNTGTVQDYLASLKGADGTLGGDGKSAYDLAVDRGYVGTLDEWIDSLQGEDGTIGVNGKSAYQIAVANGFVGTEQQWLASLQGYVGADGKSAYQLAVINGYVGTEAQWLLSLKGATGQDGLQAPVVQVLGTSTTNVLSQDASTKLLAAKSHTHAAEDIVSGTLNDARLSLNVALYNRLATFISGVEAKITGAGAVAFKAWNTTTSNTVDIAQFIQGAVTDIKARVTYLGWFDGAGFRVNGRQNFINQPYMDPAFLLGKRDIPQTEKDKLKIGASFTNNVYIGVPITNTYNGQAIVQIGDDGKRYSYWADEDNKWYRDLIGTV